MYGNELETGDYMEPRCLLCMDGDGGSPVMIPVERVIDKEEELLGKNDYEGAERVLWYWYGEAVSGRDEKGRFSMCNELMGLYRKTGKKDEALAMAGEALDIGETLGISDRVPGATAFINAGTVYKAFGMSAEAVELFEKARAIYERDLGDSDARLGGLYNNYALVLADNGDLDGAKELFLKALDVMKKVDQGELEQAVTQLNLADLAARRSGGDDTAEIGERLKAAEELLETESLVRDGYYAFVCEKCAPTFLYYGYFIYANELKELSKKIYERA